MKIIIENYSAETDYLLQTMQTIDSTCEILLFQDSFFAPDNIYTISDYFSNSQICKQKDIYYATLNIPPFWQIFPDGYKGSIFDMGTKKAQIYFKEPLEKRYISRVEWFSDTGQVYKTDYYNKYGFLCCVTLHNTFGSITHKTYYSHDGKDILSYNLTMDSIILFENGKINKIFTSSNELKHYILKQIADSGETLLLTSQSQLDLFATIDQKQYEKIYIVMNTKEEINYYLNHKEKYHDYPLYIINTTCTSTINTIPDNTFRICYSSAYKEKKYKNIEALILTMSDQIENILSLINDFPDITFHIAANTAVSDILLSLKTYSNVRIYPQISITDLQLLLERCCIYFDINYGYEIHNALIQASLHNLIIWGFKNTLHNPHYVLEECIYDKSDYQNFAIKLRAALTDNSFFQTLLQKQSLKIKDTLTSLSAKLTSMEEY